MIRDKLVSLAFIAILVLILSGIVFISRNTHDTEAQTETITYTQAETTTEARTEPATVTEIATETEPVTEPVFKPYDFIPLSAELQTAIYNSCNKYAISYELTLAIIKTESEFRVDVVGDSGNAVGLCQIWEKWWGGLANERGLNIHDPADNVELMLIILSSHLKKTEGRLTEALQIYNTGEPYGDIYANRVYDNLSIIESEVEKNGR